MLIKNQQNFRVYKTKMIINKQQQSYNIEMNPIGLDLFQQDSCQNEYYQNEQISDHFYQFPCQSQNIQPTTAMTKYETVKINEEDIKYKNLPKMIGNNIVKWIKKYKYNSKNQSIPEGLKKLIELREKEKQSKIKIKDLRDSISAEQESQMVFKEYIADQLYLDLVFSNKISDPFSYVPGISNYYSAAEEPEKMKGNYMMKKEFIDQ
ncbi:unnamed protein product [Paramecium sonneborni]|uniref:Uncharacterized protein n=1 Tax=Paramecium sonneborni TaxID=65129 RepID=A0A8S1PJ43_9CILI|nr:unnamed protein product [Paramecium sonneborni]